MRKKETKEVKELHFDADRTKLIGRLEQVQAGLSTREVIQQASSFAFDKGRVTTFNEEVACSVESGLPKEFTGAIPAKPLLDIMRRIHISDIKMRVGHNELIVTAKKKEFGIVCDPNIVLPITDVETPVKKWRPLSSHFLTGVDLVQESAGKDTSTIWVNVHIHPKYVEACNNDEMSRFKCRTPIKGSVLVRQTAIKALPGLDLNQIQETSSWIHFRNADGLVVSLRKYADTYPNLSPFFKIKGSPIQLPKSLIESLDNANVFSSENADSNVVTIALSHGRLRVHSRGMHGWYDEPKKIKYTGPKLVFMVQPKLLTEIVKNHSECELAVGHKLKVESGRFKYVASMLNPEEADVEKTKEEKIEEDANTEE
jgi:hypothetical protein